ncbi:hypothetical protein ACJVDH_19985 [Pedobacter sp. AW1-32]|uniref:hypothetical protein n=1 Tax=Pedobacter sp. AW1-32 TaxID=3383026 RepID=UPI003FED451F
MSKTTGWLVDPIEKIINDNIHTASVVQIEMLGKNIKRVSFKCDAENTAFQAGGEIIFKVSAEDYRQFSISDFNVEKNIFQVIFYLSGSGYGNEFAKRIDLGNSFDFVIDNAKVKFNTHNDQHFFFGDETSLGLYECFGKVAMQSGGEYFGILEVEEENADAVDHLVLRIDTVSTNSSMPAQNALTWMDNMHPKCWEMWKDAAFYLTGKSSSVKRFKQYLKGKGVGLNQIVSMPYW